jgi:NAD(P)H dehydrogenase (quinone)
MKFDPLLHKGYKVIQELEPDLKTFQANLKWADHFVIVYPIWWSSMPSLLKAVFERMWLPAFAFHFWKNGMGWDKLMKGKTARIITLSRSNPLLMHFLFGDFTHELRSALLEFSGYKTSHTAIGNSESLSPRERVRWERRIAALARRGR